MTTQLPRDVNGVLIDLYTSNIVLPVTSKNGLILWGIKNSIESFHDLLIFIRYLSFTLSFINFTEIPLGVYYQKCYHIPFYRSRNLADENDNLRYIAQETPAINRQKYGN